MGLGPSCGFAPAQDSRDRNPPKEKPVEILKRILTGMESAEARLKKHDPGDQTRKIQRDVVKDLDDLIKRQDEKDVDLGTDGSGDGPDRARSRTAQRQAKGGEDGAVAKQNSMGESQLGRWGELPLRRRLEMDAHSRERLMPRYEDILRRYYRSIAEQSRRD